MDEKQPDALLLAILIRLRAEWPDLIERYAEPGGFKIIIHVAAKREQARIEWPPPISQVRTNNEQGA